MTHIKIDTYVPSSSSPAAEMKYTELTQLSLNIAVLLQQYPNHALMTQRIVDEIRIQSKENTPEHAAYLIFSGLLRNNTESDSLKILTQLQTMSESPSGDLFVPMIKGAENAFKQFQRWGCQIGRYRADYMPRLAGRYTNSRPITLEDEMNYGEQCFKDAEEALRLCTDPHAPELKDNPLDFLKSGITQQGSGKELRGMRLAMGYLMNQHYKNSIARGADYQTASLMRTGRSRMNFTGQTPISSYAWAKPIVNKFSEIARSPHTIPDLQAASFPGYALTYKSLVLTEFVTIPYFAYSQSMEEHLKLTEPFWWHGKVDLHKTWPWIEVLNDEIMNFPLDKNNLDSLKQFYDKLSEIIWLLGHSTPAHRGTGKLVEQYFCMAHMRHGMRTPILSFKTPQFDVLNLSFPLSQYKEELLYAFELESLPKPIADMLTIQGPRQNHLINSLTNPDRHEDLAPPKAPENASQPNISKPKNNTQQVAEQIDTLFDLKCTFWDSSFGLSIGMPRGISSAKLRACADLLKENGISVLVVPENIISAELVINNETAESLYIKLNQSVQNRPGVPELAL